MGDPAGANENNFDVAAGDITMAMKWYQPKWQKNDYYQYNFRVNHGDSVTAKYCDTVASAFDKKGATKPMSADAAHCVWGSTTTAMKGLAAGAGSLNVAIAALVFGAATIAI